MPTYPTELVNIDDVYAHLNINNPDGSQDLELMGFIDAATAYIQNATGPILPTTFTETHSGGGSTICLFNPPVLSVTSVIEYVGLTGYALTQSTLDAGSGAYAFTLDDPISGVIRRRWAGNLAGPFMAGDHNVVVTYVAGQATVPADIRMAVLQDIAGLYQPSQLGPAGNGYPIGGADSKLNPIGMFPRVAEILSAATMRVPGIA